MGEADRRHLVLIGPAYPYRGGIAHFTETLVDGLCARGHTVSVVTFTRQYPERLFPGKTQYETEPPPGEAVPPRRLIDSLNPLTWRTAARYVAAQQPDAVIFQHWMPFFAPAYGWIARRIRRRGIRVLAVVHNARPHEQRPGDAWLSRYFFKACQGFLALSAVVERDLRDLGVKAPILRREHPVYDLFGEAMPREEARAHLGLDPGTPVLLFFGFVRRYKGLHVLLDAMPRIVEGLPGVRLLVAGEFYDDEAPYRDQVHRHGLEAHVRITPEYLPKDDVACYFSAADVVVQPYVTATQSGVAQIAFHFDRPVIVTDVGGLAEVVPDGEAGLVVPPEDPAALAAAVVRFFEEDLRDQLTDGVQRVKQRYAWDRVYEAIEDLL